MSMPDEISTYVHDFLRGTPMQIAMAQIQAKEKYVKRNAPLGFQLGQIYQIYIGSGEYEEFKVVKKSSMVSFMSLTTGEIIRRKPQRKPSYFDYYGTHEERANYVPDNWYVEIKRNSQKFKLETRYIHSPK